MLDYGATEIVVEIVCRYLLWMSLGLPSFDQALERQVRVIAAKRNEIGKLILEI